MSTQQDFSENSTSKHSLSNKSRSQAWKRFATEEFDFLIIGGGITGAAVARDAASRGLLVALVERGDFAEGTSSRSSKLIHGGLRYLENFEFHLVFEALAERAFLLRTAPHMVRPLPFYLPVYQGDAHGKFILALGMWLYDLLSLFRAPGFHQNLSRAELSERIPFLKQQGLKGGFKYFDASMWDDVLTVETLRAAHALGAAVANYTEAVSPIRVEGQVRGYHLRCRETGSETSLRAKRVISCTGPWSDQLGEVLSPDWKPWLSPSKGVHLVFDLKRIPVPGALVMSHPKDGRISFVIPRPDMGPGVTIVGTTDGPTPADPAQATIDPADVEYLLGLLQQYFPELKITSSDILSGYVGVRPLVNPKASTSGDGKSLQKVSREHSIDLGPGEVVFVGGGKYTTHRTMGREIVDFTLKEWKRSAREGRGTAVPERVGPSQTDSPINPQATLEPTAYARSSASAKGIDLPEALLDRYGAEALEIYRIQKDEVGESLPDPVGFPCLGGQLLHEMRTGLVLHLEDFYLRRSVLYAARADHGLPWAEELARLWARELNANSESMKTEVNRLTAELARRSAWKSKLNG